MRVESGVDQLRGPPELSGNGVVRLQSNKNQTLNTQERSGVGSNLSPKAMTRAKKYLNVEYKVSDHVPAPTDRHLLSKPMDITNAKRKMNPIDMLKTRNSKCIIPQRIIHLTDVHQQQSSSVFRKIENTAKAGAGVLGGLLGNVAAFSQNMFMMKKRSTYIPTSNEERLLDLLSQYEEINSREQIGGLIDLTHLRVIPSHRGGNHMGHSKSHAAIIYRPRMATLNVVRSGRLLLDP